MKHRWLGPWRASFDSCTNASRTLRLRRRSRQIEVEPHDLSTVVDRVTVGLCGAREVSRGGGATASGVL